MLDALVSGAEVARSFTRPPAPRMDPRVPMRSVLAACATVIGMPAWAVAGAGPEAATTEAAEPDRARVAESGVAETLTVTGVRPSLVSAQETKRRKTEIVDSVAATDIHKLPDASVSDALTRVTGVQVTRDRGEGAVVTIRGLTQMEATLNGRELFTAGAGRNLDFADVPSELLSRIDVYKTGSAELLDGGLGGLVDLRTRRPFDYPGLRVAGSERGIYGSLAGRVLPQSSLLVSNRWRLTSGLELGVLADFSYQDRPFREDQKSAGAPKQDASVLPGVTYPNGTSETSSAGTRRRLGGSLVVETRLSEKARVYVEGSYVDLRTRQDSYQINVSPSPTPAEGTPSLFAGTHDLRSITWTNAPISVLTFARDTRDRTGQLALGGEGRLGDLSLSLDVSRDESSSRLDFSGFVLGGTAPSFSQDLSGRVPRTSVSGVDLLDPSSFRAVSVAYRVLPFDGDLTAARADAEVALGGVLERLSAGVRVARRNAGNLDGLVYGDTAVPGSSPVSARALGGLVASNPSTPFFPGSSSIGGYLAGEASVLRDQQRLRTALGITVPIPTVGSALAPWRVREDTAAAYAQGALEVERVTATVGVRAVSTHEAVSGNQSVPNGPPGTVAPIDVSSRYLDWLPSLNLRWSATDTLVVRAAASRTITRPDFSQLSPSLLLIRNSVDPTLNQGSAGNPELRAFRASNLDAAVEAYLERSTSVYVTGFYKWIDGFLASASAPEVHDGDTYQVSRPYNTNDATVRGLEAGYQQFYDFLPGVLRGLGVQANYTYVDSETLDPVLLRPVTLQNLSRHSLNVVAMYELDGVSARIAYSWRDRYLSGATSIVGVGRLPIYTRAYGLLDASVTYRLGETASVTLEGVNLLRTVRDSRYGAESRRASVWRNDLQVSLTLAGRI